MPLNETRTSTEQPNRQVVVEALLPERCGGVYGAAALLTSTVAICILEQLVRFS